MVERKGDSHRDDELTNYSCVCAPEPSRVIDLTKSSKRERTRQLNEDKPEYEKKNASVCSLIIFTFQLLKNDIRTS